MSSVEHILQSIKTLAEPTNVRAKSDYLKLIQEADDVETEYQEIKSNTADNERIDGFWNEIHHLEQSIFQLEQSNKASDVGQKIDMTILQGHYNTFEKQATHFYDMLNKIISLKNDYILSYNKNKSLIDEVCRLLAALNNIHDSFLQIKAIEVFQTQMDLEMSEDYSTEFNGLLADKLTYFWFLQYRLPLLNDKVKAAFNTALTKAINAPNATSNLYANHPITKALEALAEDEVSWYYITDSEEMKVDNILYNDSVNTEVYDRYNTLYDALNSSIAVNPNIENTLYTILCEWYSKNTSEEIEKKKFLVITQAFIQKNVYQPTLIEQETDIYIQLEHQITQLNRLVTAIPIDFIKANNKIYFNLSQRISGRFYKPTNPVLVLQRKTRDSQGNLVAAAKGYQPQTLYWKMQYRELVKPTQINKESPDYATNTIQTYFSNSGEQPDFTPRANINTVEPLENHQYNSYMGSVLLADSSKDVIIENIDKFIAANSENGDPSTIALFKAAKAKLIESEFYSQVLGDFNDALLNLMPAVQIPIYNPSTGSISRKLPQYVNAITGDRKKHSPISMSAFNPFRAGMLEFVELALFDSFGMKQQILDTQQQVARSLVEKFTTAETLRYPGVSEKFQALLRPRFVMPAKISARWVNDMVETNDIHHSTPICGWLVPNNLSQSLMIYDTDGTELGSLLVKDQQVYFMASYRRLFTSVAQIQNSYLKDFVNYILKDDNPIQLLYNFISLINESQHYIDPDSYVQSPEMAIFSGNPVALVRMKLDFQMHGKKPSSHREEDSKVILNDNLIQQGFQPLNYDLNYMEEMDKVVRFETTKTTRQFENIDIPVRLGDYQQLNDGLIGYWRTSDIANRVRKRIKMQL